MNRAERRRKNKAEQREAERSETQAKRVLLVRQRNAAHADFLEKHRLKWTNREKSLFVLELFWVFFGGPLVQFYYLWIWKPKDRFKKDRTTS